MFPSTNKTRFELAVANGVEINSIKLKEISIPEEQG